ncbi:MAG: ExbD/TolR family protein [Gemmatimonadales bacterium]
MAGSTASDGGLEAQPNVLPMIDILLVMIVVFMILNAQVRHAIPVQLPPATSTPGVAAPQLVLELGADGSFRLNSQPVPAGTLEAVLQAALQGRPNRLLFIQAAPGLTYAAVITAMDRARGAGAEVIGLVPRGAMRAVTPIGFR